MPSYEIFEKEIRRLQYLEAMGVESYIPRQALPGGLASVEFDGQKSFAEPLAAVPNVMIADKSALQKLQQDLGSPQRKVPAAQKIIDGSALTGAPVNIPRVTAEVVQFQLAIFQPVREFLVLVPAQHTDTVHLQLLKNILLAIAVKSDNLIPVDNFVWPPRVTGGANINRGFQAVQETLQALLEGYQLKSGIKHVLFFAGTLADKLFPAEMTADQMLTRLNVLTLPDLQQMLEDGAHKKITWQKIRSLTL